MGSEGWTWVLEVVGASYGETGDAEPVKAVIPAVPTSEGDGGVRE